MGEYVIVGVRKVDYVSKKTGNPVKGYNLYCTFRDAHVDGVCAESVYINVNVAGDYVPAVGDHIQILYNRFGSVSAVQFIGNY